MNPQTKKEFDKLLSQPANQTCIDCDAFNPQWASVSNGVFLCIKCAGHHRGYGVHISFMRSVTMDSWSKIQLGRIKAGGNARIKKFWKSQKFPKSLTAKEKYDNEATQKYRDMLLAEAKGENVMPIEFIGYKPTQYKSRSVSNLNSFGSNSVNNNHNNNLNTSKSYSNLPTKKYGGFGNPNFDNTFNDDNNNNKDVFGDFGAWVSSASKKVASGASGIFISLHKLHKGIFNTIFISLYTKIGLILKY